MRYVQLSALSSCVFLIACASYTARTVPITAPESYAHRAVQNGLTVVADVYGTEAKYRNVFDTIPSYERGYLAINLVFFNDSDTTFSIDPTGVTCTTQGGTVLEHIPASQVAEQVLRSTTGRYLVGGILAAGSSKGANDKIRGDFAAKELKTRELAPGARSQGFLFFANREPLQILELRGIKNTADDTLMTIRIPMPDVPLYRD